MTARGCRAIIEAEILEIVQLHRAKKSVDEIAKITGCPRRLVIRRLNNYGISVGRPPRKVATDMSGDSRDPSCPKFARHDEHVAQLIAHGGYARLSERRVAGGVVACLPLIPFQAGA